MEQQQSFSPGLLYSVAPEHFAELHLHDEGMNEFEWEEHEALFASESFTQSVFSFLKITAAKWGISKL
ncbi:MAG: hypothetical protein EPO42_01580 [Gallionellaceae bacterium]|nr:MAG: hypothetical protein EPO42_01580 [Gallionellaceae bacterium]